jgi:hypothetical protein
VPESVRGVSGQARTDGDEDDGGRGGEDEGVGLRPVQQPLLVQLHRNQREDLRV